MDSCSFFNFRPEMNIGSWVNGRIQLTGLIGVGAYGAVYSAIDFHSRERLAVKVLPKLNTTTTINSTARRRRPLPPSPPVSPRSAAPVSSRNIDAQHVSFDDIKTKHISCPNDRTYKEVALHLSVHDHTGILTVVEVLECAELVFLVLEYFPRGDLFHVITDLRWYIGNDRMIKDIFIQIVDAVSHCHRKGLYHCDLKPENILVQYDGSSIRLADFGLATNHQKCCEYGCGSSFYMSPERVSRPSKKEQKTDAGGGFDTRASDIWSLGVILLNLASGRNPWKQASNDDESYAAFVNDGKFLYKIFPITSELNEVLRKVFCSDPKNCISLDTLRTLVLDCPRLTSYPSVTPRVTSPILAGPLTPAPSPVITATGFYAIANSSSAAKAAAAVALSPVSGDMVTFKGLLPALPLRSPRKRALVPDDIMTPPIGSPEPAHWDVDESRPLKRKRPDMTVSMG
jgi:serine/threonine protein kinase